MQREPFVALVTGATRGIGRGIAEELGTLGATVYITGRSAASSEGLPGSSDDTAEAVTTAGGFGVPVACDHADDDDVKALFQRIGDERGYLDVLVNCAFPTPEFAQWLGQQFWVLPFRAWDAVIDVGLRSHFVASALAVPLMLQRNAPIIVNISSSGAARYSHNLPYGVGKAALDRMTADMAHELRDTKISVISLWPGVVRTEFIEEMAHAVFGGLEIELPGEGTINLAYAETPRFTGRAVCALVTQHDRSRWNGRHVSVYELAGLLGFTDIDGRIPNIQLRTDELDPS